MSKPTLNICLLGNVDCGKSTLTGKLLEVIGGDSSYSEKIKKSTSKNFVESKNHFLNFMDVWGMWKFNCD